MPSQIGICGNDHVDALATTAHDGEPSILVDDSAEEQVNRRARMLQHDPQAGFARGRPPVQVPSRNITRSSPALLHRLRTTNAFTQEVGHIIGLSDNSSCSS